MCFCDGYSFLVTNKTSGEKHFIDGDENLCEFFEGRYSLPHLFHRLLKKEYVRLNRLKWNLLNYTELKTLDYGKYALDNTDTCYIQKDNKLLNGFVI